MTDADPPRSSSSTSAHAWRRRPTIHLPLTFRSGDASPLRSSFAAAPRSLAQAQTQPKWFSGSDAKDALRDLIAGATSGLIAKVMEYPFDVAKVLYQSQPGFTGPVDAALKTVRAHGYLSLFKGLTAPAAAGTVENAVVFTAYGAGKHALGIDDDESVPAERWRYAAAGSFSGIFSATMLTPLELGKTVVQVQDARRRLGTLRAEDAVSGPWDALRRAYRDGGIAGVYRGHVPCLLREIPGNAAWFGTYESVVREVQERGGYASRSDVPLVYKGAAGALGGMCYWILPYPFDTIKSLMTADKRFNGWSTRMVARKVLQEHGPRGLYRGLGITLVRAAPEHFFLFVAFESVADALADV